MSASPRKQGVTAPRARIALAGTLRAEIGGLDVAGGLPGRQGRALFAFLVVNRHRPVSRGELIDVLWPYEPPEAPELVLHTDKERIDESVALVLDWLEHQGLTPSSQATAAAADHASYW